jgi:RNase P/RNase MRP subunit p29
MKGIARHELIGKQVEASGFRGRIIDESKEMISIKDQKGTIKKFIKKNHEFKIIEGEQQHNINGKDLVARPEDRIKKKITVK